MNYQEKNCYLLLRYTMKIIQILYLEPTQDTSFSVINEFPNQTKAIYHIFIHAMSKISPTLLLVQIWVACSVHSDHMSYIVIICKG